MIGLLVAVWLLLALGDGFLLWCLLQTGRGR